MYFKHDNKTYFICRVSENIPVIERKEDLLKILFRNVENVENINSTQDDPDLNVGMYGTIIFVGATTTYCYGFKVISVEGVDRAVIEFNCGKCPIIYPEYAKPEIVERSKDGRVLLERIQTSEDGRVWVPEGIEWESFVLSFHFGKSVDKYYNSDNIEEIKADFE